MYGNLPEYFTAVAGALATHIVFQFHEFSPVDSLIAILATNIALYIYLAKGFTIEETAIIQLKINAVFMGTLFSSIGIYRRFFHRCRRFPGPFFASLTKFWAYRVVSNGHYDQTVRKLHQKYGDIVRVGPRELDICNVNAIAPIFGINTQCTKGPWYEGTLMGGHERFLQNEKPDNHEWKRRIWEAGLNSKSIREYEPYVLKFIDLLVTELKGKSGEVVDLGLYISFFAFDLMGELGFGESFNMLKSGKQHDYMTIVQGFAKFNSTLCTIPWLGAVFGWLPKAEGAKALFEFGMERFRRRRPQGRDRKDVFSTLLAEDRTSKQKYADQDLILESFMLVIAGSDTTSSSLATICYYLISNPDKYSKLKDEIDAYKGPLSHTNLAKFQYLNAVIREALRLLPPIRSGMMHRTTPPQGLVIDGYHIPGNTNVGIGAMEIQRDPRYYGEPDSFIPERWLGEGPEPFDRNAYLPFSYGPYSCVGKHLAYLELCDVIAALVRAFDMSFAEGFDASSYEDSLLDRVISTRAKLPVNLKLRE